MRPIYSRNAGFYFRLGGPNSWLHLELGPLSIAVTRGRRPDTETYDAADWLAKHPEEERPVDQSELLSVIDQFAVEHGRLPNIVEIYLIREALSSIALDKGDGETHVVE